jgi:hypothetical protein
MTRAITSNNYTEMCSALICAFAAAIRSDDVDINNAALDLAMECGWDWEADESFTSWALKATTEESLVLGLQKALATVQAQYDAYVANRKVPC